MSKHDMRPSKPQADDRPKVSVLIITYNHEEFIAQALESAINQDVDFDYEIVVGEDCSTDSTRRTVVEYLEKYPELIRPLLRDENVGMHRNLEMTLRECNGKYVALLEGDDYWTCPDKLQKQAGFLDENPEFAIVFHNAMLMYDDERLGPKPHRPDDQKEVSTIEDLLKGNYIPTCSVMFRNKLIDTIPDWYYTLAMGDWPLHIFNAQHGKIGYMDEVMADHRIHSDGAWTAQRNDRKLQLKALIEVYEHLNGYLEFRYEGLIRSVLSRRYRELAEEYERSGEQDLAEICAGSCAVENILIENG